jgi:hypothetical protein
LVGAKLASAGAVTSWTVLIIEDRVAIQKEANFVNAVDNFRVKCAEIGLEIGPYNRDLRGVVRLSEDPESEGLCRVGDKLSKMAGKVTFVLVIFDFHNELKYSSIKLMGDLQYGVLTVCMKWHMMSAGKSQYISNVALKLNLKLGGTNHTIQSDSLGSLRSGRKMIVSSSSLGGTIFEVKRI